MAKKPQMVILEGDGSFQIEVSGESHYFKNLRAIMGDLGAAGSRGKQAITLYRVDFRAKRYAMLRHVVSCA